jgi:hypothetical protein
MGIAPGGLASTILNASPIVCRGGIDSTRGESSRQSALKEAALSTSILRSSSDTHWASCVESSRPVAFLSIREDSRVPSEVRKQEVSSRDLCTFNEVGRFYAERSHTMRADMNLDTTSNQPGQQLLDRAVSEGQGIRQLHRRNVNAAHIEEQHDAAFIIESMTCQLERHSDGMRIIWTAGDVEKDWCGSAGV